MASQLHEVLVAMVRDSEALAPTLVEWATGQPLPADVEFRTRDQAFSELKPAEYRADLVLSRAGRPTAMMVLEVQLARDLEKRYAWPGYQVGQRRQYRCPTMIVVLAPAVPAQARSTRRTTSSMLTSSFTTSTAQPESLWSANAWP